MPNCAWTAGGPFINAPQFKELGVEFLEHPLRPMIGRAWKR